MRCPVSAALISGLAAGALFAAGCGPAPEGGPAQPPAPVRVAIITDAGTMTAELDPARAPATVANFLRYVDAGAYDGGSFFRTVRADNQGADEVLISVVQAAAASGRNQEFPPIALETTAQTGLRHLDGTLSMARAEPHTATAPFFIGLGDQPALDYGGARNPDGQGFAAFGRVVEGLDVVRRIHAAPADGQLLTPAVAIIRIERVDPLPASTPSTPPESGP